MKKIDYIREFVKNIDSDFEVHEGEVFEVDIVEEEIYFTFKDYPEETEMYQKFLEKDFGKRYNPFVISLLHEIGHIMTYDDDLNDDRTLVYGLLKVNFDAGKSNIEEYNNMYFHIPAEFDATSWAVDYYETHFKECEKLAKII